MMILDDIYYFSKTKDSLNYIDYLRELLKYVHELQYQNGDFIIEFCDKLRQKIRNYAFQKSPIYKESDKIITKDDLEDKSLWYVNEVPASASNTGGSTAGKRFHYRRWAETYLQIEGEIHYKTILKEFELDRKLDILYFMLDQTDDQHSNTLIKTYTTNNVLISHGMRQQANIHEVIKNKHYYTNYYRFYEDLIEYLSNHKIDVILTSGQFIYELTANIKRLNHTSKICDLISNTGSKVDRIDLKFLKENGIIDNWCDNMRCWDGGVTFFSCKYEVKHLLDGLAWASESDNKLISDDFYSLPAPFVNYWNGDYAMVGKTYKRCKCGRSYREFSLDRHRQHVISGITQNSIVSALLQYKELLVKIKKLTQTENFIRFFTFESLSNDERKLIRSLLPTHEINFVTENL